MIKNPFHLKRIRWVATVTIISVVLIPVIAILAGAINRSVERVRMTALVVALRSGIANEESATADAAKSIASDIYARGLATTTDVDSVMPFLKKDQQATLAAGAALVDSRGMIVARTYAPQEWGDYIYQATPYGRTMARGNDFSSVETGAIYPLVITSGSLIKNSSGDTIASIITGKWFDDNYVREIASKYLGSKNAQLVVYSNEFGVVGSSFADATDREQITRLFNPSSDLIRGDIGSAIIPITIGKTEYVIQRIIFDGTEKSPGGAFVLMPYDYVGHAAGLSALLVTIAWLLLFTGLSYRQPFFSKIFDGILLGAGGLIVFLISFHADILTFEYKIPVITEQKGAMYNSVLSLYPSASIFDTSFSKFVSVQLSSGGEPINAIRAHIQFNQRVVSVEKLDVTGTLCEKGVILDSVVDNEQGTILFSCVIPGGYQGPGGTVVRALLRPINAGDASLSFAPDSQVLASDGLGTNVLRFTSGGNYIIGGETDPLRLLVFSPSHPNENQWYSSRQAIFSWSARSIKNSIYAYTINQDATNRFQKGDAVATTTDLSAHLLIPEDGDWYFHVAAVTETATGPVTTFPIHVDATPPRQPTILLSDTVITAGNTVRLVFGSDDATSGLQRNFYVSIDDQPVFLPAVSPLFIPLVDAGRHSITVRAIDNAGNSADATVTVTVEPLSWWDRITAQVKFD